MPDENALGSGQAEQDEMIASADVSGGNDWPVTTDQIAAMTPAELARFTGMDGAFRLQSRAFRQSAGTTYAPLAARLNALAEDVMRVSPRERPNPKLAENVRLIALNLYSAYRQDDRLCTALPMAMKWYSTKAPRNPAMSFRITVQQAWGGLAALGFAEVARKGSPWGGSYTLVRATPALIAFLEQGGQVAPFHALRMASPYDPVVLKGRKSSGGKAEPAEADTDAVGDTVDDDGDAADDDGKERPILFAETPDTERMRANVVRINAVNTPDRIRLPALSEDEREALFDVLWGEEHATWRPTCPTALEGWFAETALRRIFNRGSFLFGGRFYGAAWQQMPKVWRNRILIDGEPVVELDYGSLHPRMAHHLYERVEAPEDCYAGIDAPREIAKKAVSALINMENGATRPPRWFTVKDAGMPWASLFSAIAAELPRIVPHFATGVGLQLQRVDSDIAEQVMLHFAERDIPCLGVHDSFIVAERHSADLEATMRQAYRSRVGFEPVIKAG